MGTEIWFWIDRQMKLPKLYPSSLFWRIKKQDKKYDIIFNLFSHIYSNIYTIMDQTNFVVSDEMKNFTLESVEMQDKVFSQTNIFLPNEI